MPQTHRLLGILSALLILSLATGCFAAAPKAGSGEQSSAAPSDRPVPPKAGNAAWDFTLPTLQEGESIRLSDLRGKKVMINFWATWCGPCRVEIPAMIKLYEEMRGQGFEILAVNLLEEPERVGPFVEDLQMNFPVLLDTSGKVSQAYYVRGIPTTIFVDEEGIIRIVHVGTLDERMLRNYVRRVME